MKGGGSAPASPSPEDYMPLVEKQAEVSRTGRTTPFAQTGWGQDPSGMWSQETSLSPELQGLWGKQFQEGAYDPYAQEAFAASERMLAPQREQQMDRFETQMAAKGIPIGSEAYGETYQQLADAQERASQDATFRAQQYGQQRQLSDYNKLMSAMGGAQVPGMQTDVMGPAQMAMQGAQADAQRRSQQSSNLWNTAGSLGAAYLLGPGALL